MMTVVTPDDNDGGLADRVEALIRRHERGQLSPADEGIDLHHSARAAEDFPKEFREQAKEVLSTPAGVSLQRRVFDVLENGALNAFGHAELVRGLRFLSQYHVTSYRYDVSEFVSRGERPSASKIKTLVAEDFAATVNLCAESLEGDGPTIASAGLEHRLRTHRIPVVDMTPPSRGQMVELLDLLTSGERTYVHCEAGWGRTGVVIACYRIAVLGWSTDNAIDEAKRFHCSVPAQLDFIEDFGAELAANATARRDGNLMPHRMLDPYPLKDPGTETPTEAQLIATLESAAAGKAESPSMP